MVMAILFAEQLNVKFISYWPEAGGDLYHDNVTGSSFVVRPGGKIATVIAEVRKKFEEASHD